jgi:hypothetical protein
VRLESTRFGSHQRSLQRTEEHLWSRASFSSCGAMVVRGQRADARGRRAYRTSSETSMRMVRAPNGSERRSPTSSERPLQRQGDDRRTQSAKRGRWLPSIWQDLTARSIGSRRRPSFTCRTLAQRRSTGRSCARHCELKHGTDTSSSERRLSTSSTVSIEQVSRWRRRGAERVCRWRRRGAERVCRWRRRGAERVCRWRRRGARPGRVAHLVRFTK